MKKLLLLAMVLLGTAVQAQVKFTPGLRAGVNFAKISDTDLDYRTDFFAAAAAGIRFTKVYTLQPEIGYSRQGAKGDYSFNGPSGLERDNINIKLSYVTFTLINKFTIADRLSLMVGPTLDILVERSPYTEEDADVGITAGIGCKLADGLGVEFRIKKGFVTAISDGPYTDDTAFFEVDQASNFVMQLGLTYTFNLK